MRRWSMRSVVLEIYGSVMYLPIQVKYNRGWSSRVCNSWRGNTLLCLRGRCWGRDIPTVGLSKLWPGPRDWGIGLTNAPKWKVYGMRSLKYQDSEVCVLRLKTKRQKETMFPRKCERCASLPVYLLLEGLLEIPILLDVTFSECGAHFEVSLGKQQIGRQREQQKEKAYQRGERKRC